MTVEKVTDNIITFHGIRVSVFSNSILCEAKRKEVFLSWRDWFSPEKVEAAAKDLGVKGELLFLAISEALDHVEKTPLMERIMQNVLPVMEELDPGYKRTGKEKVVEE